MFRDSLAIEKCRLESILWARRIAGGGPDYIFYESDNEGFIVRCITDLHERRDRARASGLCSCGAERAPGYRLCPVCHGRERDRQRRQVATCWRPPRSDHYDQLDIMIIMTSIRIMTSTGAGRAPVAVGVGGVLRFP